MTLDAQINVSDANGAPIAGTRVSLSGAALVGITDKSGTLKLPVNSARPLQLTINHPSYVTELVSFQDNLVRGSWDNSLVSRHVSDSMISLRVVLGRCAPVPTALETDADLASQASGKHTNPNAALLFHPPRFPDLFAYRFQWYDPLTLRLARDPLVPEDTPDKSLKGWDRFVTVTSGKIAIADSGRFFWLFYPQQPGKPADRQYAVAVWSPNLSADQPVKALDMVLFYSPTTSKFEGDYPFGLVQPKDGGPPDQPYMTLGKKYLLDEYCFAYDQSARSRNAVIVMPICRRGDWGPFTSGEGAFRLLREVAVFLHRECRTSNIGVKQTGYNPAYRLAGASLRSSDTGIRSAGFGMIPAVGKVVVCFFSSGASPVKQLMNPSNSLSPPFSSQYWGIAGAHDPNAAFAETWSELWDMDGFHPNTGGWGPYLTLLRNWYSTHSNRIIRLCHSSGRVPPDPLTDSNPFWQQLLKEGTPFKRYLPDVPPFGFARELQGHLWSIIAFSDAYVANGLNAVLPLLGDAHHATAKVAFSHASAMTSVG